MPEPAVSGDVRVEFASALSVSDFLLDRIEDDEADSCIWHDVHGCNLRRINFFDECSCGYPSRVLAECEAKRQVIEACSALGTQAPLYALAAIYTSHPDFDPSWAV